MKVSATEFQQNVGRYQDLWPGPDLSPVAPGRPVYGVLPPAFFRQLRDRLLETHARRKVGLVPSIRA